VHVERCSDMIMTSQVITLIELMNITLAYPVIQTPLGITIKSGSIASVSSGWIVPSVSSESVVPSAPSYKTPTLAMLLFRACAPGPGS
jgi:hypothetical protein